MKLTVSTASPRVNTQVSRLKLSLSKEPNIHVGQHLTHPTHYDGDFDLDFMDQLTPQVGKNHHDGMFGPEEAGVQWDFYCQKFARSFDDIKKVLLKADPGKDSGVLRDLNAGKDPVKVFSEYAARHLNVFKAVSSASRDQFLKHVSESTSRTSTSTSIVRHRCTNKGSLTKQPSK